jgi:flavin reductase (DIM6/NTAB) family NADH-FMN oxidoreductase RutF
VQVDDRGPVREADSLLAPVTTEDFKRAAGSFPTGVTVVTTMDAGGRPYGCTANSFTSVSLDPPLVLCCLDRRAPSLAAIRERGQFAINVLSAEQEGWSRQFARRAPDKFAGVAVSPGVLGLPLLDGCLAALECALEGTYGGGDHLIVVGRVHKVHVNGDDARPLLFYRGRYLR